MELGRFYPGDACTHVYTFIGVCSCTHSHTHTHMHVRVHGGGTKMHVCTHIHTDAHTLRIPGPRDCTSVDMKVWHCPSLLHVAVWAA